MGGDCLDIVVYVMSLAIYVILSHSTVCTEMSDILTLNCMILLGDTLDYIG